MMKYDLSVLNELSPFEFRNILNFEAQRARKLKTTFLESREDLDWQLPDKELEKLYDPKIKVLFIQAPETRPFRAG